MKKITVQQVDSHRKGVDKYRGLVNEWLKSLEAEEFEAITQHLRENKMTREAIRGINKFGVNSSGSMRLGMSIPYGLLRFLEFAEPEIWQNTTKGKMSRAQLFKECPELTVAEKL